MQNKYTNKMLKNKHSSTYTYVISYVKIKNQLLKNFHDKNSNLIYISQPFDVTSINLKKGKEKEEKEKE